MNKLALIYSKNDPTKTLELGEKSYSLSEKLNYIDGIAYSYSNIGNIYADIGEYDKAIKAFEMAIIYYKKKKWNLGVSLKLRNIGDVYLLLNEPKKAMERTRFV